MSVSLGGTLSGDLDLGTAVISASDAADGLLKRTRLSELSLVRLLSLDILSVKSCMDSVPGMPRAAVAEERASGALMCASLLREGLVEVCTVLLECSLSSHLFWVVVGVLGRVVPFLS